MPLSKEADAARKREKRGAEARAGASARAQEKLALQSEAEAQRKRGEEKWASLVEATKREALATVPPKKVCEKTRLKACEKARPARSHHADTAEAHVTQKELADEAAAFAAAIAPVPPEEASGDKMPLSKEADAARIR